MLTSKPSQNSGERAVPTIHNMDCDRATTTILASVKEQELQFERLTWELEMERQIVATQLERCRLGSESPGTASVSSTENSLPWRSAGSVVNSHSPTQLNSYPETGYQDAGSYFISQGHGKSELRLQHSFQGSGGGPRVQANSRAEGQTAGQASGTTSGAFSSRALERVCSMPSRTRSPYGSSISPTRGSFRTMGFSHGSSIITEPKLRPQPSSTIPLLLQTDSAYPTQKISPVTLQRIGSSNSHSGTSSRINYSYSGCVGSVEEEEKVGSRSSVNPEMAAVPQFYKSTMPKTLVHESSDPYNTHSYKTYERISYWPDSLTGVRSSYTSQRSQMGPDLRSSISTDRHIGPIYEEHTFHRPLYRSSSHAAADLNHNNLKSVYRSSFGVGNLQRSSSQRSNITYHKSNYNQNRIYSEPFRFVSNRPSDSSYTCQPVFMDDYTAHSPSIESIPKDQREFAWRDPELREVIHMLQHQFPSVRANAAAYLQHLCYGDNRVKTEVCRLGGIKQLVDLLDHNVLEVQRHACGALRNLVYGRTLDNNKIAVKDAGGISALLRLLRTTVDTEVRELVTGVFWNLSSCDALKMTIIHDALSSMLNTVIIPHSGWNSAEFYDERKLKFHASLVLRNTTGCLRNLSSAGEEARKQMRCSDGLVDSLLYVIKACISTSDFDSKIVENCICTLRNLSYRLELEMPPSQLTAIQESDAFLGYESTGKQAEHNCLCRKKRKKSLQQEQWDGVGPIPGFTKTPKGAEILWHPSVVKPYLTLLAESSNPATLEGSAGSLQNLSAGNWKFAAYIRAAVRKEKGLPILVELLRMDNDRVVWSIATALRNMALDVRNKELIGKYAMRDLVNRLPAGNTSLLSDDTMIAICCTLHEVTSRNMENAKALADTGGIEKLVNITKGRGESRNSIKVSKAAAQVLNGLWQYRDLRTIYKKDGWNQSHFMTPITTLEREHFKSQPTQALTALHMSTVHHTGSAKPLQSHKEPYTSPSGESLRCGQQVYYADEADNKNYDTYSTFLQSHAYEDSNLDRTLPYSPANYSMSHGFRSSSNYVDFNSSTRRPLYQAEHYQVSPDSWV